MTLIDKAALLNRIATEVHYDSEHSLEMYAKLLSEINDAPDALIRCKDCIHYGKTVGGIECQGYCKKTEYMTKTSVRGVRENAEIKADRNGFVQQDDLFPQGR